ncbi:MAG: hypothetical protein EA339_12560 [Rhodobacteraceae bacterium]|nr:MAG: hypothetical protein EA339_12560 [Paracoccaceae bacterium]
MLSSETAIKVAAGFERVKSLENSHGQILDKVLAACSWYLPLLLESSNVRTPCVVPDCVLKGRGR